MRFLHFYGVRVRDNIFLDTWKRRLDILRIPLSKTRWTGAE